MEQSLPEHDECIRGGPSWPLHRDRSDLLCFPEHDSSSFSGEISTIYATRKFITVIEKARHLSCPVPVKSGPHPPTLFSSHPFEYYPRTSLQISRLKSCISTIDHCRSRCKGREGLPLIHPYIIHSKSCMHGLSRATYPAHLVLVFIILQ
jgi:hypothetical protein